MWVKFIWLLNFYFTVLISLSSLSLCFILSYNFITFSDTFSLLAYSLSVFLFFFIYLSLKILSCKFSLYLWLSSSSIISPFIFYFTFPTLMTTYFFKLPICSLFLLISISFLNLWRSFLAFIILDFLSLS